MRAIRKTFKSQVPAQKSKIKDIGKVKFGGKAPNFPLPRKIFDVGKVMLGGHSPYLPVR